MLELESKLKGKKNAVLYFHCDLDGVTSAIKMKYFLEEHNIKVVDAVKMQYGPLEYAIKKPIKNKSTLNVMVDFANSNRFIDIHTDHHNRQIENKKSINLFENHKSNASMMDKTFKSKKNFTKDELEVIDMIDSAGFLKYKIKPEQISNPIYKKNKDKKKDVINLGLVVNKLLLSYKNKPDFLRNMVLECKPSFKDMYNYEIKTIASHKNERYWKQPEEIVENIQKYIDKQEEKSKGKIKKTKDILNLENGESAVYGDVIIQYGGGYMSDIGSYDRYTPFKLYPNAKYLIMIWYYNGLIQITKNPWYNGENIDIPEIVNKIMENKFYKLMDSKKEYDISFATIKKVYEWKINDEECDELLGFDFEELKRVLDLPKKLLNDKLLEKYMNYSKKQLNPIKKVSKKDKEESYKAKRYLKNKKIKASDIIKKSSGGHMSIMNLSGFNFIPSEAMMNNTSKIWEMDKSERSELWKEKSQETNNLLKLISIDIMKELNKKKPK